MLMLLRLLLLHSSDLSPIAANMARQQHQHIRINTLTRTLARAQPTHRHRYIRNGPILCDACAIDTARASDFKVVGFRARAAAPPHTSTTSVLRCRVAGKWYMCTCAYRKHQSQSRSRIAPRILGQDQRARPNGERSECAQVCTECHRCGSNQASERGRYSSKATSRAS